MVRDRSKLSQRQSKMLEMIRDFTLEYGYPPTIRQIGEEVGISSTSVVSYNLNVLQRKGYLLRDREISRGLRLVDNAYEEGFSLRGSASISVPLLGTIAAGEPISVPDGDFSSTDYERIALTSDIVPDTENVYALRVRGDSMIDALINDGDIVIMRHQCVAENGDLVAAWLKDEKETTLKRIYWEKNRTRVRLQPANPRMDPIYVHPSNLEIQGKVIVVIRQTN
ncbi:MAG: repressor LexA [Chloroflexi bacterium RBG_13_56_8]|nr:MAG: repressor LexA [Chloroflexi bacterium RBG_13_56_8]